MQAHRAHQHSHRVLQIAHATAAYTFMAIGLASGYSIPAIMPVCALAASAAAACMLIDMRWSICYAEGCRPLNMNPSHGRDARACVW